MRNCQIFTPDFIVDKMLDMIEYQGENIRNKTIFEPSFGNGAFLIKILKRVIRYAKQTRMSNSEIIAILDKIYGIEIDKELYEETIRRLNAELYSIGLTYSWSNLICTDSLSFDFGRKFDLIIANPPFIRVHGLTQSERDYIAKHYRFGNGNTDLYVIFFELCIQKMNHNGKLCFISPNSFLRNTSQSEFRKYLVENNLVETIIDYEENQVFENVLTYSAITLLNNQKQTSISQFVKMETLSNEKSITHVNLHLFGKTPWTISTNEDMSFLEEVKNRTLKIKDICDVQYGVATNADKIYLVKDRLSDFEPELLRPVIKGSTLSADCKIIFPYKWNTMTSRYEVIPESEMQVSYPKTYAYLLSHKNELLSRDMEKDCIWYQYARSQGIQNSKNKKIVLKHILSPNQTKCELMMGDDTYIVYSGIYVVAKNGVDIDTIREQLASEDFYRYAFLSGKNMSGGYKNINSKTIKEYGLI